MNDLKPFVIFHLDEVGNWSTENYIFEPNEPVKESELASVTQKLLLRAFTLATRSFKSTMIRFFLSGTNLRIGQRVRLGTGVKVDDIQLPLLDSKMISQLLGEMCDLKKVKLSPEQIESISSQLVGPPRIIQTFMGFIFNNLSNKKTEDITFTDLSTCLQNTKGTWKGTIQSFYDGTVRNISSTLFDQFLIAFSFFDPDPQYPNDAVILKTSVSK